MAREDKYKEINAVKNDKMKALDAAISQIEKQYGKGSIMKLGDNTAHMNVETIPTGALSLDLALGLGGLPKGTDRSPVVRLPLLCTVWQRYRRGAVLQVLLMRSMP